MFDILSPAPAEAAEKREARAGGMKHVILSQLDSNIP
jgi:hypothetical protein